MDAAIDTLLKSATNQILSTNITIDYLDLLAERPSEQQDLIAFVVGIGAGFNAELIKTFDDLFSATCVDERR